MLHTKLNSLYLPKAAKDTRVVVAMSGGVDSSVVAGLLKDEGYDVIGITLQLYDHGEAVARKGACCAGQDIHDARRVAETLNIPHYVLNYERRFASAVIDSFADSYLSGETPVPCVTCNQTVKFKDLLATAKDLEADALATGHYIQSRPAHIHADGAQDWQLLRAVDAERDQSYFMFTTTKEQLSFLRFPLGGLKKSETRSLAEKYNLKIAHKPDSQDICFVPSGRYTQVIERLRPGAAEPGDIVDLNGTVVGQHEGIINFTIGQRKGIGISAQEPLYVIRLDAERREVVVGTRDALRTNWVLLRDLNWIGTDHFDNLPSDGLDIYAKVRSTQPPLKAKLHNSEGQAWVQLMDGEDGVSPGQACVFYTSDDAAAQILGGGWIRSAHNAVTDLPIASQYTDRLALI
ncbi:MAG: tRNA 2-thiouridine(34) synthase MnmA [Pseudomonadota bacterium]